VGGWPTVRYFNSETGYNGAPYVQKTKKSMCDELGDREYMNSYISEKSLTPCDIATESNCNDEEKKYITTWNSESLSQTQTEFNRLEKVIASSSTNTKTDSAKKIMTWMRQRTAILKQFISKKQREL